MPLLAVVLSTLTDIAEAEAAIITLEECRADPAGISDAQYDTLHTQLIDEIKRLRDVLTT